VAAAIAVVVASGCGASGSDKAGGGGVGKPVVLTLANGNGSVGELQAFADEVAKRSDGALRIAFSNRWRLGERDYEVGIIGDVKAGRVALGAAGSRAFDAVGVRSFEALHAPFAIDSHALQEAVFESRIPGAMLEGLQPLGIVGLGVLPGPLRHPLSAKRPLRRPHDFAGLRVGYQGETAPADLLRALGATPVQLPARAPWRGIDAIEQQVASINLLNYDAFARYLTANVTLFPRPNVIFASRRALASLSASQRALLRDAAEAAVPGALRILRAEERAGLVALCRRGIDVVSASADDVARLRTAAAPVLAALRREPETRSFLASIATLRARQDTTAEPSANCPGGARPSTADIPDGSYTVKLTADDIKRSGLPRDETELAKSRFELVLKAGGFVLYASLPSGEREIGIEGTYSQYRDRFVATGSNGDKLTARWSFDGTELTFTDFRPRNTPYELVWASQPWKAQSP